MRTEKNGFNFVHAAIIFLFAFLIYSNILVNGFILDDKKQIINNPWTKSLAYFPHAFFSNFWAFSGKTSNYYRPFVQLAYTLIYSVFGLSSWGYHLGSLILHAANSVLVYWIALFLIESGPGALIAGLVFAAHPVHVEAVAQGAAGYPDLLAGFFSLAAFVCFIKCRQGEYLSPRKYLKYFLIEFAFMLAALLSKESAFFSPVIFIVLDLSFNSNARNVHDLFKKYAPLVCAYAVYLALRYYALDGFTSMNYHPEMGLAALLLNATAFFSRYFFKIFFPVRLNAMYIFHPVASVTDKRFLFSALIIILFMIYLVSSFKKGRKIFFPGIFFSLSLMPCLYIPGNSSPYPFAERYLYIPSAGFALFAGLAFEMFPLKRNLLAVFFAILLVFYGVSAFERNRVWQDDISFLADVAAKHPGNDYLQYAFHYDYGRELINKGMVDNAITQYQMALSFNPPGLARIKIYNNLGSALLQKGNTAKAAEIFQRALFLKVPYTVDNLFIHLNLAKCYIEMKKPEAAIAEYKALGEKPDPSVCAQLASMGYSQACK